jgi:hypothetical protein
MASYAVSFRFSEADKAIIRQLLLAPTSLWHVVALREGVKVKEAQQAVRRMIRSKTVEPNVELVQRALAVARRLATVASEFSAVPAEVRERVEAGVRMFEATLASIPLTMDGGEFVLTPKTTAVVRVSGKYRIEISERFRNQHGPEGVLVRVLDADGQEVLSSCSH